jgi:outer membrane protein assembly factor BamA
VKLRHAFRHGHRRGRFAINALAARTVSAALCAAASLATASSSPAPVETDGEGQIRIKEIRTYGNLKTSRGIMLHYCEFKPGDVLSQDELDRKSRRTRRNLLNTQFFSRVNVFDLPRGDPHEAVVMLDVAEGTDWHLSASTWQARLSKENIGGDAITLGLEFGLDRQRLFYEQRWIFDLPVAVGASGFFESGHRTLIESDTGYSGEWFDHEAGGGEGSLAYIVTLRSNLGLAVLGEYINYYEGRFKEDPLKRFGVMPEANLVAARPFAEWDGRDNDLYPTKGAYAKLQGELSSPAVGDYDYAGFEGDVRAYASPWRQFVLAARVKGGSMSDSTPYVRRISIRGADGLRYAASSHTIGTKAFLVTTEIRRRLFRSPIFDAWFEGVAFVDAGRAWDPGQPVGFGDFDYAFGPGIRVHMRSPFYFDWRAELNVYDELSFYATAHRAF